jgi:iron(III) transport system ATP-binding protein
VFVADFIGGANLVKCEVVAREGDNAVVKLGPLTLKLPSPLEPQEAMLVVRPSAARIRRGPSPGSLPAEVRKATYLGSHWDYSVATDIGDMFITQADGVPYAPGAPVHLIFEPHRLALVAA